jgi:hypothetical protein
MSGHETGSDQRIFVYHPNGMYQDDPGLEQRLSRFEAQLDRFSLALRQWQAKDQPSPAAPSDIDQRIATLERTLDREAHALRQLHEEPLKQLQAQAASLRELCAAATNSVNGLGRAELRLEELQGNVSILVHDLSRTVQALVNELQANGTRSLSAPGSAAAWPLERVVHLHDELRRNGSPEGRVFDAVARDDQAMNDRFDRKVLAWLRRRDVRVGLIGVGALVLVVLVVAAIESRLNDASERVVAAEKQVATTTQLANQEVAAARQSADRQIAEARQVAQRAETVGSILTAPDLIRFTLTSTSEDGSSAQLLWSRTRGLVLSGNRLPAAPPESTYQLWLVTTTQSFGAGVFVPDASGRASLVIDAPPKVLGSVVGASVTIEPPGGRAAPSGKTLLARFLQ